MYDDLVLQPDSVRALADGLGTSGQEMTVIGRGGAVADGVADGFPGADVGGACKNAARSADRAMGSAGTALMELGGSAVAAIIAFQQRDSASGQAIANQGEAPR
ncbi:type VII secretion target [Nocardia arizonensis]|uniref:type VII secretion target n=1 Tax=Nocardia arizonensis TaxID=1141647 RepID=UPI0012E29E9D|nr:type VII secretion target [Nocardia arizonensis]